jgi:hypothetical protein
VGVDGAGPFGQVRELGDGDAGGPELFGALPGGEQAGLAPGEDDPRDPRREDVLDAGDPAGGAGAAGHQRAVDGRVAQPRIPRMGTAQLARCQLTERYLLGVVVILLLAGEPGGQHLAVLADHDRAHGERRVRRRAQPGQLHRPAQEAVIRAARAEEVAQQRDLADARGFGEGHGAGGTRGGFAGGDRAREVEAGSGGVGDEEGRDGQVELVGQPGGQEVAKEPRAALNEKTRDPSFGEIFKHEIEGQRVAGVNRYGAVPQARPGGGERGGGAVDQAGHARGEEAGPRIEVAGGGQGDPGRVRGQAAGGPAGAAARVPDQQPRVVFPYRPGADQDGVAARPHLVHPVQVGRAGQDQPPRAGVVQVAVRRGGTGQDDVGAGRHGPSVAFPMIAMLYWSGDA